MLSEDEERFLKRTEILVKVMPVTILILLTISGLIIEENKTRLGSGFTPLDLNYYLLLFSAVFLFSSMFFYC